MRQPLQLIPGQHVHFIGIGGTGLSAIARVLLLQGYHVTGSDLRSNNDTENLQKLGATIYRGHNAAHVMEAELVIRSSAVADDHVEVMSAQAQKIPVYKRSDVIASIMDGTDTIAVAGTHGKTTTTSMVSHILIETGADPGYIIGGALANTGLNADVGQGTAFVIEADEYDNMFHGLKPDVEVVTSVEFDHPDYFKTPNQMVESFSHFVGQLDDDGILICCADDVTAQIFARNRQIVNLPVITYGIEMPADWRAVNIRYQGQRTLYDVIVEEEMIGTVDLGVPGKHNILNSLAALIVACNQDTPLPAAIEALASFQGAGRRFDIRAEVDGKIVIDDYAHHPTAIRTTIDAARQRYPDHDLWAIWQPHTYSRTRSLREAYTRSFGDAPHLIVTDIYAAREKAADFPGVSVSALLTEIDHPDKHHFPTFDEIVAYLLQNITAPAVILIMSAGDAPEIGKKLISHFKGDEA